MRIESLDLGDLDRWAQPPKIAGSVRPLADFADQIIEYLSRDVSEQGDPLPWAKTQRLLRLRPHELTVWAGENGSWKSTVLSQVLLDLAIRGRRVMLASLEMTAAQVGARMARQACCEDIPRATSVRDFLESTRETLVIVDVQGQIKTREAIALLRWAAVERQMHHIALDNLTKIVSASSEAAGEQQQFLNDAHSVALDTGAHIHIVAHVRKPAGNDKPSRYDIRGSSTISDQADNIVMCWRNRPKEEAIEEGKDDEATRAEPDLYLKIAKQRHAPFEGSFKFWKHAVSMQFLPDGMTGPIPYAFERGLPQ
jgi:twinkle protein